MIQRLQQWWRHFRHPPVVEISHFGQKTDRPQVHVSVCGLYGSQGVYTFDANDQGEACATMYARGLADIMRRRLVDRRSSESQTSADNETPCAVRDDGSHCECWYGGNKCCGCEDGDRTLGGEWPTCAEIRAQSEEPGHG
jgi:hypothetical protein